MKTKIAFFDFDDTLIHGDSIKYLLEYYIKKHPLSFFNFFKVGIYYILYLLKMKDFNSAKTALLFPLKKMDTKELEYFYQTCIIDKYYKNVVEELKQKKAAGYLIMIVSASVEAYLQCCDLPVDIIMGTRVIIKDNHYTNIVIGKNCKNEEKVRRINEELKTRGISIDYDNSYAYSDSTHDIPMLKLVKNRIKINKKNGEMSPFIVGE